MDILTLATISALVLVILVQLVIIRGATKTERSSMRDPVFLTGREIELIKRKIESVGMNAISINNVLDMIHTINGIQLGTYTDLDPFLPHDPYEDVDEKVI